MAGALLESLLDRDALADALRSPQPAWLAEVRRAAADSLAREGLPEPRTEAWKYTSLRALEQRRPVVGDAVASSRAIDAASFDLPEIKGPRLVFVNGVLRGDLSRAVHQDGLSVATLAAVDAARIPEPLHLVFIGTADDREIAWHVRALIEIGAGASLRLIEHHVEAGMSAAPQFGNVVAQYALGAGARLDLVQIQNAADDATLIRRSEFALADDAVLSTHALEIGAQLSRHDFDVDLGGKGARFASRGVFALRARQHADTHLDVRHDARDTVSDVIWRGVADQRARGVFHGAITVAAGADGSDANLSNKNLLLSPHAEIDTQPVLEIYADEVKAAHGATVGQLDERALFYLRSRGIPPETARHLLIAAFCGAALGDMPFPGLREHLDALLASRLPRIGDI